MNNLLDEYRNMFNSFKQIDPCSGRPFVEAEEKLGYSESKIGKQFIADNPDIWGEYNYIIFDINIDSGDIIPIKCVDLDTAREVSNSLQRKYYNTTNIYFIGIIHPKIIKIDPYTGREGLF